MKKLRYYIFSLLLASSTAGALAYTDADKDHDGDDYPMEEVIPGGISTDKEGQEAINESRSHRRGTRSENSDKKEKSSTSGISIIALLLGAGGVGFGVFNYKKLNALRAGFNKYKNNSKKEKKNIEERIDALQQDIDLSRHKIEQNMGEIASLQSMGARNKASEQTTSPQRTSESTGNASEQPRRAYENVAQNQHVHEPEILYCGVPTGGVFTNISKIKNRQSLYVITDKGGNTATYTFLDDPNTAMIAARSKTEFLDPGCVISGDQNGSFRSVRTIHPGVVQKTATGWRIISKAEVKLV
ncbi:MAG: hypothetical protein K2H96_11175 [Muribaculaceae bacterium]|nr:hypothetical protein [Muribaculaceae bacterium]